VISYVLEARKTKEYQSSTLVRPQAASVDLSQFGGQTLGPQNIDALARLIKTTAVAAAASKHLKNPTPNSAIIEKASPSGAPVNHNTRRAIELGLVLALLLGIGAVAIAENSDRRVRSPDDLEEMTGLPLLSAIPSSAFDPAEDEDLRDEEAFQMLRGALMYFNVDQRLQSVVVTSPGQEDGKTTVSVRLAQSAARAGRDVILVDADLRRPQIGPRLHLNSGTGLGPVLSGEADLWSSLIEIPVSAEGDSQITAQGSLRILPAGPAAPNPSELLSSEHMERVLRELESRSDLVIVDSAAALAVSDALPLLRWTTGVIMIARLNRSTRAGIRRLQKIISAASGNLLGVVATGAPARGGYDGYGYGYGYKDSRARKRAEKKQLRKVEAGADDGTEPVRVQQR
jgi:receptor protein-tyrosine kinase